MREFYKEQIAMWEQHLLRTDISAEDRQYVREEHARMSLHLHRLETDHAECVEPCCPGCKLGGLTEEERAEYLNEDDE